MIHSYGYRFFLTLLLMPFFHSAAFTQSFYSLEFTENRGQWNREVHFRSEVSAGALFLHANGFTVLKHHEADYAAAMESMHGHGHEQGPSQNDRSPLKTASGNERPPANKKSIRSHAFRVYFQGADPSARPDGGKAYAGYANFLLGNDPSTWASNVKSFQEVVYRNVYPNIDVRYYSEGGRLKYDFVVRPGGDVRRILMRYDGASRLSVKNGELVVQTTVGETREMSPYSYQVVNGVKKTVDCRYEVKGNQVNFKLGSFNPSAELVIDPTILIFASYTGSRSSNWGFTATPGPDGSFFAGGIVFGSGYPVSTGAVQPGPGGGTIDIGITRFSPTGNARIYSTYIGGGGDDYPHSLISDPQGNLVMLGRSNSVNYPDLGGGLLSGAGTDIVISKLNAAGTAFIGSVKIGGGGIDGANIDDATSPTCNSLLYNYGDNARSEVILDGANNVYIVSSSQSTNFPTVNPIQNANAGDQDAVVMKLTPNLNTVLFSTYLGGSENDAGFVLSLNPVNGDIYVGGATSSNNFPGNKGGTIGPAFNGSAGDIDGYLAVINNNGTSLIRSTYLGTKSIDIVYGVQFDQVGFPYIMGISLGSWTVTANAPYRNPGSKQFISKLQPDLSAYVYSTVFGSANPVPNISPVAFLVDRCENVYVSGWGGGLNPCPNSSSCFDSKTAGTLGMPVTPDAISSTTDNRDFYFFVMERNAASQLYGSFIGQGGGEGDHVDGGTSRYDRNGSIYQAVCANCGGNNVCPPQGSITSPFPITPGVIAPVNGAIGSNTPGECNLAAIKIQFDYSGVAAGVQSAINGVVNDSSGCVPLTVNFSDTLLPAQTYIWDFGDGSPTVTTTANNTTHTYTTLGSFLVKLVKVDNTKCIPRDSSFMTISVRNDRATLDLNAVKLPPCESLSFQFDNLSIAPPGKPFTNGDFTWDFGDNSPRVTTGAGSVNHTYAAAGTYNVRLILNDTSYCNGPDSITRTIRLAPNVEARFETPDSGCVPYLARIENTSLAGQTFIWDFGDGSTFTGANPPPKLYVSPGSYTITLIAIDPSTCNIQDTTSQTINVYDNPIAGFSFSPNPGQENTPTQFTNTSVGAVRYFWAFGDGDTSTQVNPVHQYNATGDFDACLVAFNQFGCRDTVCQQVSALIVPLLDVPNAFTPNGDGVNDRVFVRGFGIAKMTFRIYNRWGQVVFQSADQQTGWDGRFKGELQPMDAYGYTLEVQFSDGSRTSKKGDITLVR
jgi:gliding motility-associated-like protein